MIEMLIAECGIINEVYNPDKNSDYAARTYPLDMGGVHLILKDTLPSVPAIYFAVSRKTGLLYIGKAKNLNERWQSHHRYSQLEKYHDVSIAWISFPGLQFDHLGPLEAAYIKHFLPPLNQTPVNEDFVDTSGRDPARTYFQVGVLKNSDFGKYLAVKAKETGVHPRDQILLYASAHFDMIRGKR